MDPSPKYHNRYCAFVDILGFRQLIDRLTDGTISFDALHSLLTRVHVPQPSGVITNIAGAESTDFRAQSISDAVAISTAVNAAGLAKLFQSLQSLALDLLAEGFFVRGSIVKAPLYHDDRMVFGEGLVKAYYFESEVAKFPRIVVTQEVRNDVIGYVANSKGGDVYPRTELLRQSSDGPAYLDILQPVVSILKKRIIHMKR